MSHRKPWKESDGDFLLVIAGSTYTAQFLTGWQEFKDSIRMIINEQPGWVDVYSSQTRRRDEMQGWARLRSKEDAEAAYKIYSRQTGLLAHLWETRRSSEGFQILRCNCSSLFPEVPKGSHSAGRCGIDLERFSRPTGGTRATYSTVVPQYPPPQPTYEYAHPRYEYTHPTDEYTHPRYEYTHPMYEYGLPRYEYAHAMPQFYNVPAMYPSHAPPAQAPVYSTNTYGMPVNIRNGAIRTESRGIFIQKLSYKCTPLDLYDLLLTVAKPEDYKLLRDDRTGRLKGRATARFASQDDAQRAAYYLNGVEHMGMTLKVRLDKETTDLGPLIVSSDMDMARYQ